MSTSFDVIITTYNRSEKVNRLCRQIMECSLRPGKLIVVDSSDATDEPLKNNPAVVYRKSSHKSQPYQRYVGSLISEADILVFFDDDLIITDLALFERIIQLFGNKEVAGVGLGIEYHNIIAQKLDAARQVAKPAKNKIKPGHITLFGETGGLPHETIETLYLPGPNMSFRRSAAANIFDPVLFGLFEQKMGMGEDKVLSMRMAKQGKLIYSGEKNYLLHPAEESSYFTNPVNFYAKVYYSRLWLANQYSQLWSVPFTGLRKLLYLAKTFAKSTNVVKLKAFIQTIKWIIAFGWNQQYINKTGINYKQQALKDAGQIII